MELSIVLPQICSFPKAVVGVGCRTSASSNPKTTNQGQKPWVDSVPDTRKVISIFLNTFIAHESVITDQFSQVLLKVYVLKVRAVHGSRFT